VPHDLVVDDLNKLDGIGSLVKVCVHAGSKQILHNGVSWPTLPVKVLILRHVDAAEPDVLLDKIGVLLRILAVERVALGSDVVEATAYCPYVRLPRQLVIWATREDLRSSVLQMAGKAGALEQFTEIVRHANEVPLDQAILQVDARWVQIAEYDLLLMDSL
jgi:hypothetical protein